MLNSHVKWPNLTILLINDNHFAILLIAISDKCELEYIGVTTFFFQGGGGQTSPLDVVKIFYRGSSRAARGQIEVNSDFQMGGSSRVKQGLKEIYT